MNEQIEQTIVLLTKQKARLEAAIVALYSIEGGGVPLGNGGELPVPEERFLSNLEKFPIPTPAAKAKRKYTPCGTVTAPSPAVRKTRSNGGEFIKLVREACAKLKGKFQTSDVADRIDPKELVKRNKGTLSVSMIFLAKKGELIRHKDGSSTFYENAPARDYKADYETRKKELNISVPRDADVHAS